MEFKTDKVYWGYVPTYERMAAEIGPAGRVCELGVLHGDSLDMWLTFFPKGIVVGVDQEEQSRWPVGTYKIVSLQDDERLVPALKEYAEAYDLIVDDCSHQGHLTKASFDLLWPLVAPGGWYVIEDWMVGLPSWGKEDSYNLPTLHMAQEFLLLLDQDANSGVEDITYRWGQIILRKQR